MCGVAEGVRLVGVWVGTSGRVQEPLVVLLHFLWVVRGRVCGVRGGLSSGVLVVVVMLLGELINVATDDRSDV